MEEINKRIYYLHSQIDLLPNNFSKIYGSSTLSCFSISMAKNCQNGLD